MTELIDRLTAALADRYRILREVGAGGMATVYLAEDLRHGRQVALKVLRPELAATMGSERFFREIQVAARLQHPHILPLHDSGEAGDGQTQASPFLYYVMPYVEGESLRERLARSGELPIHDAVKILVEVVDALAYAHQQGVVHRDIKPDNVMLSGRHALVTDFGVAKAVSEATGRQQLTTAGVALGTPSYMAPEQAAADPNLDHRVDIYAVGAMAYELLTGRPPFTGMSSQQILAAHVTQAPEPLSRHRPSCPPALEAVVMRCLAKRAADRWQTAEELLQQLEPLATPSGGMTPTQTRPVSAWQPAVASSKRRPVVVGGVAVVLAALAWFVFRGRAPVAAVPLERVQVTFTGNAATPGLSQDGRRIAYRTRQCDSLDYCTFDVVVQDIEGAGAATVLRGARAIWNIEWGAEDRYLLLNASFGPEEWGAFSLPSLGGARKYLGCCAGILTSDGDTAVITRGAQVGDSLGWIRWVTLDDGVTHDSLAFPSTGDDGYAAPFPGGQRLLVVESPGRRFLMRIIGRSGTPIDSFDLTGAVRPYGALPGPDGRSLLVMQPRANLPDELDVIRYPVTGRGEIRQKPDTVARQLTINAGSSLFVGGAFAYGYGPVEYSVWTLQRTSPAAMEFTQRRVVSSTAFVTATLSPKGSTLLFWRRAPGQADREQMSVMPFQGGAEVAIGGPVPMVDFDWTQDERAVIVGARRGDSIALARVEVPSGRSQPLVTMALSEYDALETVPGGGMIVHLNGSEWRRMGVSGLADSTFVLPDEVGSWTDLDPSPDGKAFVLMSWNPPGDSILVHRVSIEDGGVTRLAALGGEGTQAPRWLNDGTIILPILETSSTLAWYRMPATGGTPVRLGTPPHFPGNFRLSEDGLRGMARAEDQNSDVYLIPNFGEVLKR